MTPKGPQLLSRRGVPDVNELVEGPADQAFAVGREAQSINAGAMRLIGPHDLAGVDVPEAERAIPIGCCQPVGLG